MRHMIFIISLLFCFKAFSMPLSWDERAPWSEKWTGLISKNLQTYEQARDLDRICPNFKLLSNDDKTKVIAEFFVALAYYESGFKPTAQSVDVGRPGDKDSWSVGLYQLSVRDSVNRNGPQYNFDQLTLPLPNIELAHLQMLSQIKKCGKFILPNSSKCRYWAVILDDNTYSKIDKILARLWQKAPFCLT